MSQKIISLLQIFVAKVTISMSHKLVAIITFSLCHKWLQSYVNHDIFLQPISVSHHKCTVTLIFAWHLKMYIFHKRLINREYHTTIFTTSEENYDLLLLKSLSMALNSSFTYLSSIFLWKEEKKGLIITCIHFYALCYALTITLGDWIF